MCDSHWYDKNWWLTFITNMCFWHSKNGILYLTCFNAFQKWHSSDISDIFCIILTFLDWHPDHFWSLAWHSPWHSGSWVKLPVPQWIYQAWNWPWGTDTWREKDNWVDLDSHWIPTWICKSDAKTKRWSSRKTKLVGGFNPSEKY